MLSTRTSAAVVGLADAMSANAINPVWAMRIVSSLCVFIRDSPYGPRPGVNSGAFPAFVA
jgi:hypothetical protein